MPTRRRTIQKLPASSPRSSGKHPGATGRLPDAPCRRTGEGGRPTTPGSVVMPLGAAVGGLLILFHHRPTVSAAVALVGRAGDGSAERDAVLVERFPVHQLLLNLLPRPP